MFEDSLMESGGRIKTNQKWTGSISTLIQLGLVGFLVLLPLIFTEALPKGQLTTWLVAPPPPPPPPPPAAPQIQHVQKVSEIVDGSLRAPTKIPKQVKMIAEEEAPAPDTGVMGGVVGGVPGGSAGGVIGGIIGSAAPPPKVATPQKLRVSSGVAEGLKIHDVKPTYPQMARIAHIQGDVILQATISKSGSDRKPSWGTGASNSHSGCDGCCETVEVQTLYPERRAGGSGNNDQSPVPYVIQFFRLRGTAGETRPSWPRE